MSIFIELVNGFFGRWGIVMLFLVMAVGVLLLLVLIVFVHGDICKNKGGGAR